MCRDHLVGRRALDLIADVGRQLGTLAVQAGHHVGLSGDLQGAILVGNVIGRRDIGRNYESAIDEHGVRHVLRDAYADGVEELDVADARLDGHRDIADRRVEADIFDLAEEAEQRLHLILGRLRCDVGDLHDFGNRGRRLLALGRHRAYLHNGCLIRKR